MSAKKVSVKELVKGLPIWEDIIDDEEKIEVAEHYRWAAMNKDGSWVIFATEEPPKPRTGLSPLSLNGFDYAFDMSDESCVFLMKTAKIDYSGVPVNSMWPDEIWTQRRFFIGG